MRSATRDEGRGMHERTAIVSPFVPRGAASLSVPLIPSSGASRVSRDGGYVAASFDTPPSGRLLRMREGAHAVGYSG